MLLYHGVEYSVKNSVLGTRDTPYWALLPCSYLAPTLLLPCSYLQSPYLTLTYLPRCLTNPGRFPYHRAAMQDQGQLPADAGTTPIIMASGLHGRQAPARIRGMELQSGQTKLQAAD